MKFIYETFPFEIHIGKNYYVVDAVYRRREGTKEGKLVSIESIRLKKIIYIDLTKVSLTPEVMNTLREKMEKMYCKLAQVTEGTLI